MARILVTRRFPGPGLEQLASSQHELRVVGDVSLGHAELLAAVPGVHAILCQLDEPVDGAVMDAAGPQLRIVANYAVGTDNIDIAAATSRSVWVGHTPGVLTEATADIAWALLMAVARKVIPADAFARSGNWQGWDPVALLGQDLHGCTLAIIGAGRIGRAVARRAVGWAMPILYVSPTPRRQWERDFGARRVELEAALAEADIVSLHVPLTEQTRHLMNRERLSLMKPGALLLNTARGPVVDEDALADALDQGRIAGVGLDVHEREPAVHPRLIASDRAVLLPHLGSATQGTRRRMGELAAANVLATLAGQIPFHTVNQVVSREPV